MINPSKNGAKRRCNGLVSASEKRTHWASAKIWKKMAPRRDQPAFSHDAVMWSLEAKPLRAVSKLDLVVLRLSTSGTAVAVVSLPTSVSSPR